MNDPKTPTGAGGQNGAEPELSPHVLALGPQVVAKVVRKYLENIVQLEAKMKRAVEAGDATALEEAAHGLKGSSGTVGAERMAGLCRRLEELGKKGRVEEAVDPLQEVGEEHRHLRRSLTRYLEEDAGGED